MTATPLREDRGSTSLFTIGIVMCALFLTALIVDGGQIRMQRRLAGDIAQQAARAGAQQVDEGSRLAGSLTLDPGKAKDAAQAVIGSHDASGTASVTDHSVTVEVTVPVELVFLDVAGARSVTATRTVDATEDV